ncbi:protein phosphatase 2C domain-containing protein [Chitinophaga agrisoli]|uniref:Protein phosphatase 2C domain-containing protein n=2 Tax=Chitinophaga agrisoli TaxID=2607653 RepID=A0A5B2W6D9_9BACT|nr:protein phosphatase 2C domain-containing protein [Chitinophaga agrisoli]
MDTWQFKNRLADIQQQQVVIPNATVGKAYTARFDFAQLKWEDFTWSGINGLEDIGLAYDTATAEIKGTPVKSGDFKIRLQYRLQGQAEETPLNEKLVSLVINPNPRSLWKDLPSDREGAFWKEDNVTAFAPLGDKHLVAASKRGRSHANTGAYRDDDFAFTHLADSGWSILAVADGAGSAIASREGSRLACNYIIDYFEKEFSPALQADFDALLAEYATTGSDATQKKLTRFVYDILGAAAFTTHKKLDEFAGGQGMSLKDFHSTLIFVLLKKYVHGYVIMSFGVGDCPIGLVHTGASDITLMNRLDVGEFGGGTRFITMPEIFKSDTFATRFGFKLVPGFSYLMLMTDGIYDPKFEVEANLDRLSAWQSLLADLGGQNDDRIQVTLDAPSEDTARQLAAWMDFWSPGNHDDRTLMIIC